MFLTHSEVQTLTGYKQKARQVEYLASQRIPFHVDKAGRPIVTARALQPARPRTQPNFEWSTRGA